MALFTTEKITENTEQIRDIIKITDITEKIRALDFKKKTPFEMRLYSDIPKFKL